MTEKLTSVLCGIILISSIIFSGCSQTKQIDKESLAETVSVAESNGKITYTFYLLTSSESADCVSVEADSFEDAYLTAKDNLIPNLSLAKFELFVVDENIYEKVLYNDLNYFSAEYNLSPLAYVTLADEYTIRLLAQDKDLPQEIEEHIILYKNNNSDAKINSLSIFNSFLSDAETQFSIPYINSEKEINVSGYQIFAKK